MAERVISESIRDAAPIRLKPSNGVIRPSSSMPRTRPSSPWIEQVAVPVAPQVRWLAIGSSTIMFCWRRSYTASVTSPSTLAGWYFRPASHCAPVTGSKVAWVKLSSGDLVEGWNDSA